MRVAKTRGRKTQASSETSESSSAESLGRRSRIPWPRLALEFVAIFTAVLLSFVAEDWREHLGDRRRETQLLRGLLEDLEVDTAFFSLGTIPTDSLAVVAGEWLQANWYRTDPPTDSINWALNGLYRGMAYAPARTEYEAARNSARLDLLQSPALRRQINTHFEQTHGILEEVWNLNWRFHFEWTDVIRSYVRFAGTFRGPIDLRPENFKQDLWPEASLAVPWGTFQQDRRAYSTLAQTNTFRRLVVAWQRANLAEIHALRQSIQRELGAL